MKSNKTFVYTLLLIVGDFLALLAAFAVAYILRVKLDERPLIQAIPARTYILAFIAVLPLWIIMHGFIGLYNYRVYEKRFSELGRLLIGSFLGILVVIGYDFVSKEELFPARLVPVYALAIGFGFLVIFRTLARFLRIVLFRFNLGITNILLIGDGVIAQELLSSLYDTKSSGYRVVGVVGKKENLRSYYRLRVFSDSMMPASVLAKLTFTALCRPSYLPITQRTPRY